MRCAVCGESITRGFILGSTTCGDEAGEQMDLAAWAALSRPHFSA